MRCIRKGFYSKARHLCITSAMASLVERAERHTIYLSLRPTAEFTQLVPGPHGFDQLPSSAHPDLHEIWRRGLSELSKFPSIQERLQRGVITGKVVGQIWWKVFKHYITLALHPSHASPPTRPVLVCGNTQASTTQETRSIACFVREQAADKSCLMHHVGRKPTRLAYGPKFDEQLVG